jgi:hypothetical protein
MADQPISAGRDWTSWTVVSTPGVNAQATATRAASAGVMHQAKSITVTLAAGTVAPAAAQLRAVLRDGATGVGAILWAGELALQAVAGASPTPLDLQNLNIQGTPGNAMTLEFTAAGGANTFEGVTLEGNSRVVG